MSERLTHLDDSGQVHMVDVAAKDVTVRTATAEAHVTMTDATKGLLFGGDLPKGDALAVARVAAITATKRTSDLIPLCHPLAISGVDADIEETPRGARVVVTVRVTGKTGVEMEAMTGASVGALTLYDMIKGVERGAVIDNVQLVHKAGGKSGEFVR
ncbi:MAG: cyclic pyranopterin monophosphate synthase MoaC [Acidimicrobiia bacterium]|nr:cyclic pyranopterin monophosphate synthase MoaC [Acidimicrobiia bacterium]